ncbi:ABC transporter ATP-binding protein [Microbacterium sp. gxy059]|uniref:ABC transporter ATP-binding protein n=1 Tax=Microbacterium sp. gxy059 TaxID=2957199 RepID=UPI003D95C836
MTSRTSSPGWALRATELSVSFGRTAVVRDASLALEPGRVTALVGPNGSGKSTTLRALCRLVRASGGSVSLPDVEDTRALSPREFAQRITLLAQQRPTPVGITVSDIVGFGRHAHRSGWRGRDPEGAAAIARALTLTGLDDLRDAPLETLSGGQLQRAWFASALAQDTAVLLLDEPTNHLDLRYQVEILDLMRELSDEHDVAVGVVLHDLGHAADVADRILVLSEGRIVADGAPLEALDPALLSDVYGIPVQVAEDPRTGAIDVRVRRARRGRPSAAA